MARAGDDRKSEVVWTSFFQYLQANEAFPVHYLEEMSPAALAVFLNEGMQRFILACDVDELKADDRLAKAFVAMPDDVAVALCDESVLWSLAYLRLNAVQCLGMSEFTARVLLNEGIQRLIESEKLTIADELRAQGSNFYCLGEHGCELLLNEGVQQLIGEGRLTIDGAFLNMTGAARVALCNEGIQRLIIEGRLEVNEAFLQIKKGLRLVLFDPAVQRMIAVGSIEVNEAFFSMTTSARKALRDGGIQHLIDKGRLEVNGVFLQIDKAARLILFDKGVQRLILAGRVRVNEVFFNMSEDARAALHDATVQRLIAAGRIEVNEVFLNMNPAIRKALLNEGVQRLIEEGKLRADDVVNASLEVRDYMTLARAINKGEEATALAVFSRKHGGALGEGGADEEKGARKVQFFRPSDDHGSAAASGRRPTGRRPPRHPGEPTYGNAIPAPLHPIPKGRRGR